MTIRLRPHHLLCMLTYVGKGYSPAFVSNYDAIAGRLSQGEEILVVSGPDDICAPLLCETGAHCLNDSVAERDRLAASAVAELLDRPVRQGDRIAPDAAFLRRMREAFTAGELREACTGCEWQDLCSQVAAGHYRGCLIRTEKLERAG